MENSLQALPVFMLNVQIQGDSEPLGFIEANENLKLSDARKIIEQEIEGLPKMWRFLIKNHETFVKVSVFQEGRKRAIDFLPTVLIKEITQGEANISSSNLLLAASLQTSQIPLTNSSNSSPNVILGSLIVSPNAFSEQSNSSTTPSTFLSNSITAHSLNSTPSTTQPLVTPPLLTEQNSTFLQPPSSIHSNLLFTNSSPANIQQDFQQIPKITPPHSPPVLLRSLSLNNLTGKSETLSNSSLLPKDAESTLSSADILSDNSTIKQKSDEPSKEESTQNSHKATESYWAGLWEEMFKHRTDKILLDEVPFAILGMLKLEVDPESDYFRALLDLTINMGPNAYTDSNESEDPKQVFIRIMMSFGPEEGVLDRITELLKLSYFHGNISSKTSELLLSDQRNCTFLLRLSNSQIGGFAITSKIENKVRHYSIERTPDYQFKMGKDTTKTLPDLIKRNASRLGLKFPCPRNPFERTFIRNARAFEYSDRL